MPIDEAVRSGGEPRDPERWTARKLRPVILISVAAVFLAFLAPAHFVIHSPAAVKALALAAVGALVPLVPGVLKRVEYKASDSGLARRPLDEKKPAPFQDLFRWDQLSHVVPTRHGFKYYRTMDEAKPFRRFWESHVSDAFSGEVHVETADRKRVLAILARRGVPTSKPPGPGGGLR